MRLKTIWTMPAMSFVERLRRTREWSAMKSVRFVPLRVRYWVTMCEIAKATNSSPNIPATSLDDILRNLDHPK